MDRSHFLSSIHLLINNCIVSTFWLLWIMLLWKFMYKLLFEYFSSILWGINPGVELLGDMVSLYLFIQRTIKMFPTAAAPFYIVPTVICEGPNFSTPCQHFVFIMSINFTWCVVVSHCEQLLSYNTFNFRLKKTNLPLKFSFYVLFSF